jgi:hypothetical protein
MSTFITIDYFSTMKNSYFLRQVLFNLNSHQNNELLGDDDEKNSSNFPYYGICFNWL